MCPRKRGIGLRGKRKEKGKKMTTVKQIVEAVLDNPERFPKGWNSDVKDYFLSVGRDHLERKQKWVYLLTINTPYNAEDPTTVICRSEAKAKTVMEEDIRETLANGTTGADASELVRESEVKAHLSNKVTWEIERKELFD